MRKIKAFLLAISAVFLFSPVFVVAKVTLKSRAEQLYGYHRLAAYRAGVLAVRIGLIDEVKKYASIRPKTKKSRKITSGVKGLLRRKKGEEKRLHKRVNKMRKKFKITGQEARIAWREVDRLVRVEQKIAEERSKIDILRVKKRIEEKNPAMVKKIEVEISSVNKLISPLLREKNNVVIDLKKALGVE